MTPERWKKLDALFHEALGLSGETRQAYLAQVCSNDAQLREEAERLLAAHEREGSFIDSPVLAEAAALKHDGDESPVGRSIGHYKVVGLLGRGGMGEVYLAEDSRLERKVALKVLPAAFTQQPDRVRRFEREAKAASALNHPNILTIHEIGEAAGAHYIVSEFVAGETLRALIERGKLGVRQAIAIAEQVAGALSAAHQAGIIHRDIKPENVIVRPDGLVKILDFGLAKLSERPTATPVADSAAEMPARLSTEPGVVMGTISYMSPEQARGEKVDHRTDVFSLGVMLYEMLAGRRPFAGATPGETIAAILRDEPPELTEPNAQVSPQLEKIVRRCLEKQPEQRFQSASDLSFALTAIAAPANSTGANRPDAVRAPRQMTKRGRWRNRIAWLVAGVLGLAILAVSVAYFKRSAVESRAVRLAFTPPENLAFENRVNDFVSVSPDGQKLVFGGRSADDTRQLWVRQLNATEATPLPETDTANRVFWSPDSRSLGFASQGKLKRIDLAGGRPQTLCDAPAFGGGTWSRAGVILFASNYSTGLFQIPATGGEVQPVPSLDQARGEVRLRDPCFLPDGRHFLYRGIGTDEAQRVYAGSLDSKEVQQVLSDAGPAAYAPPGWLLFVRNGVLMAQSFDAERLALKGDTFPLTRPTDIASVFSHPFSVSENGVLTWQGDQRPEYQLVWFDRNGNQVGTAGPPGKVPQGQSPHLSPDGKRVAITYIDPQTQNIDIWMIDLQRNLPIRLTSHPAIDGRAIWSPDGSRVIFQSNRGSTNNLYQKAVSGSGPEEIFLKRGGVIPTDWSADNRFVIFTTAGEKTNRDVWALPLFGDRQPYPLINGAFQEHQAQLSPTGAQLAYVSDESGSDEVYVQAFSLAGAQAGKLGGAKLRISTSGGRYPRFRRNGQELFYVATDGQMMAVKLNGVTFETPKALFKTRMLTRQPVAEYDVTADGQRFLIGTLVGEANATSVSVILNWTAEVKR